MPKHMDLLQPGEQTLFNLERFQRTDAIFVRTKIRDLFKWADQVAGIGREKQKSLLNCFLIILRENFVYNMKNSELNIHERSGRRIFENGFHLLSTNANIVELTEVFETAFDPYRYERKSADYFYRCRHLKLPS